AVLVLDLVDRERQVFVRGVQVFDQQREHLFVRGREQVIGALAVVQAENAVAVGGPAPGKLVRLARQESREVHLEGTGVRHLFADDALDPRLYSQAQRQPGEDTWGGATNVACSHEQLV